MAVLCLLAALVCTAVGQVAYKAHVDRRRGPLLAVALGLFAVAQLGFFLALTGLDVGVVYMSMGLSQVLVLILASRVLGESVTRHHVVAAGLILGGLALYVA